MATAVKVETISSLADRLRDQTFGTTTVVNADFRFGTDSSGDPAAYVDLKLTDPTGDTWPAQDLDEIRMTIVKAAIDGDLEMPVYITLSPLTEMLADEDELPLT